MTYQNFISSDNHEQQFKTFQQWSCVVAAGSVIGACIPADIQSRPLHQSTFDSASQVVLSLTVSNGAAGHLGLEDGSQRPPPPH